MSRGTAEPKLTAADAMIDKLTIAIFVLQIAVVLVLGYFGNIWKHTRGHKVLFLFYKQYPGAENSVQFSCMLTPVCTFSRALAIFFLISNDAGQLRDISLRQKKGVQ